MKNAIIVHGAFGSPEENWIPWLKGKLEERGYQVMVPTFPTPEGQSYKNWMDVVEPHIADLNEETIIVGHSIGATFILSILEKSETKIAKAILVSGFLGSLGNETFDAINQTISEREYDWEKIKKNSESFSIFHGANDPYVPTEKAEEIGTLLHSQPIIVPNGGHLNEAAGFTEFPELVEEILK